MRRLRQTPAMILTLLDLALRTSDFEIVNFAPAGRLLAQIHLTLASLQGDGLHKIGMHRDCSRECY
jgi:hypothetical protein